MAKRYYIIPMAYPVTEIEQHVTKLKSYGVSILDVFASVWRAILDDDVRYHLDVANYVARAIRQQWYDMQMLGLAPPEALQQETDAATVDAIDMCNDICEHIKKCMDIIITVEVTQACCDHSLFGIHGMNGNDVVVFCEDPEPENSHRAIGISSELEAVQLR